MELSEQLLSCGIDEQINSDNFFKISDYIWSSRNDYDYVLQVMSRYPHLKLFSPETPMDSNCGIIYCGMCLLIEDCLREIPEDGNYIVIQRDNERPFTYEYYSLKKKSVKHIYTIECQVNESDVTALPFGVASIGGDNSTLEQVRNEQIDKVETPVFCRLNTNPFTPQRSKVVNQVSDNPLVDVVTEQLGSDEFYRNIKGHKFNFSLQSGGKDTTRTWETLFLGTIPIISDCVELRHFEDMPVVYYPEQGITKEWLDAQDVSGKSLERAKMSYWRKEILMRKKNIC